MTVTSGMIKTATHELEDFTRKLIKYEKERDLLKNIDLGDYASFLERYAYYREIDIIVDNLNEDNYYIEGYSFVLSEKIEDMIAKREKLIAKLKEAAETKRKKLKDLGKLKKKETDEKEAELVKKLGLTEVQAKEVVKMI